MALAVSFVPFAVEAAEVEVHVLSVTGQAPTRDEVVRLLEAGVLHMKSSFKAPVKADGTFEYQAMKPIVYGVSSPADPKVIEKRLQHEGFTFSGQLTKPYGEDYVVLKCELSITSNFGLTFFQDKAGETRVSPNLQTRSVGTQIGRPDSSWSFVHAGSSLEALTPCFLIRVTE